MKEMIKIKKSFISFCTFLLSVLLLSTSAFAALNTKSISWYFKPEKNGVRPSGALSSEFLEKYDSFYIGADEKKVYLTFDAGYENGNVEKIVDVLNKRGVKGAFFVLSHFINENPNVIKKMIEGGHLICNHTSKHENISKCKSIDELSTILSNLEQTYESQTGTKLSKYFRPPEGAFSEQTLSWLAELGYKTVFWSVAYKDWDNSSQMNNEKALNLLLSRVHNGAVILLHPTSKTNADILEGFIDKMLENGYSFGSIDEIM